MVDHSRTFRSDEFYDYDNQPECPSPSASEFDVCCLLYDDHVKEACELTG